MTHFMYTVYDSKTNTFTVPFYGLNDSQIVRQLRFSTPKDDFYRLCKDDFSLYSIGTYDTETGIVNLFDTRKLVALFTAIFVETPAAAADNSSGS